MSEQLIKSESHFAFHIDGNNAIDAEILSNIINDMAQLTKCAAKVEDPEAYLKMNVTAFKNGSFEIDFSTICEVKDSFFNAVSCGVPLAASLVAIVEGFLKIKKHLKGKRAVEVKELPDNKIQITNIDEQNIIVNKSSGTILKDVNIDQIVINIGANVQKHNLMGGFSFDTDNDNTHFNDLDVINLGLPVQLEETITLKEKRFRVDLPIKKADILGNSVWSFIYLGKYINATIEDKDFMDKVHSGKVAVHAGDYIDAILRVSYHIDASQKPIDDTFKYAIESVVGDIKNDEKYRQLSLNLE